MKKRRTRVVNARWLSADKLIIPAYYEDIFPLPRDRSALRESFERDGYRPEYPLTVRPSETVGDYFEIVCGVGRFTVACEQGMRRVPAVVREMTADEAMRYAVEDNLFAAASSAALSLPQAIFLSRLLEGRGRNFPPRLVWGLTRVSESTFWRAVKSFDLAVGKAAGEHPELADLVMHRRVAEILRRDLFPEFTQLWTGSLEVHTFQQAHATVRNSRRSAARKNPKTTSPKKANSTRRAPVSTKLADGQLSPEPAKRPARSKGERADNTLPLFDR